MCTHVSGFIFSHMHHGPEIFINVIDKNTNNCTKRIEVTGSCTLKNYSILITQCIIYSFHCFVPRVVDACGLGESLHSFSSSRYELITYFVKYRRLTAGVKEDNWPMVGLPLQGFGVLHLHVLATDGRRWLNSFLKRTAWPNDNCSFSKIPDSASLVKRS